MKKSKEFNKIARSELCNRCGSCVGLLKEKLIFEDKTGKYKPKIIQSLNEDEAELLLNACAGKDFNFPEYRNLFYKNEKFHEYLGPYQDLCIAYASDNEIRKKGASGGILSAILIWLLEKKEIDGAVVLGMSKEEPWLTEPFIAKTKEQILEAAQSKYIVSSVNEILSQIEAFEGNLAYVGLPGQIQSIRKLQKSGHPSVKNIKYIFGPFYGNTLHFTSITSFLRSYKIKDYKNISKLYFRHGEWPGNMRIELTDGKIIELKKFHANYLIPFNILKNSLLCTDLTNEFTDISGGDAWAPSYEERGKGFSLMIIRNNPGKEIIKKMVEEGKLSIQPISVEEVIKMHSHGYDLKKRGSFIRIKLRKFFGKSVPDYGYKITGFSFGRFLMEILISFLFFILSTRFSRWIVERFSPEFIGKLFEKSRKTWKKSTHNIKRKKLGE